MSCVTDLLPRFRRQGFRVTPQRQAILHVLRHAGGHLSPVQIFHLSRKEFPGLTGPTVYRTLEFLARTGFVLASYSPTGKTVYELTDRQHHHLVCRSCGGSLEVPAPPHGGFYQEIESVTGYRLDFNQLTLFGLCPQCQELERS